MVPFPTNYYANMLLMSYQNLQIVLTWLNTHSFTIHARNLSKVQPHAVTTTPEIILMSTGIVSNHCHNILSVHRTIMIKNAAMVVTDET